MAYQSKYFGKHPIKVTGNVKPLAYKGRIPPQLKIGNTYFVNYHDNLVYEMVLIGTREESYGELYILKLSDKHKGGYGVESTLYPYEIGETPWHAIQNRVGCIPD